MPAVRAAEGCQKDSFHLDASDSELVITVEVNERERNGALRRRTRRTGRSEYRVTLPGDVDTGTSTPRSAMGA